MPPSSFRVHTEPDDDAVVVIPEGALDLHTVPVLAGVVGDLRASGFHCLRLDLGRLCAIDAHGVRCVAEMIAERGDRLALAVTPGPPAIRRVFALVGVDAR